MNANDLLRAVSLLAMVPVALTAQLAQRNDPVMLKHWQAPLFWQPTPTTSDNHALALPIILPTATNALVFVAITPCRVVDTRTGQGFTGPFGPPSLSGGAIRTFPIQSGTCAIPAAAQAYSFNFTVVPPGPLGFITAYPTGQFLPVAATVNSPQGFIVGNAAVVAAGTNGSIDVFASNSTDLVIDLNGYYVSQTDAAENTAIGVSALTSITSGKANTAGGFQALQDNTTGSENTANGYVALEANTTGTTNTATGAGALEANTSGSNNTASGSFALQNNTTGQQNTASGMFSMQNNTLGTANTAAGYGALQNNTQGGLNTACGFGALALNTVGSNNTACGQGALERNTSGNGNIAIGSAAGSIVSGSNSNNIHIGSSGSPSDNATIRIGAAQTSFFAAGVVGVTTGNNNAVPVVVDSNGQLGTVSSSRRFKEDIDDMGEASQDLLRLRPVTFRYKKPFADGSKPIQYGLIAEEVAEVYPDLVAHSADGQVETVKYQVLDSMLLNEWQHEHRQIEQQAETIRLLEARLAAMEQLLSSKASPSTPVRR
jgi:hypothetical protein